MAATSVQPIDEARPVAFNRRTRKRLENIAAYAERKNLNGDAALLRELIQSWDGAAGFTIVHRSALTGLPSPEGEPA